MANYQNPLLSGFDDTYQGVFEKATNPKRKSPSHLLYGYKNGRDNGYEVEEEEEEENDEGEDDDGDESDLWDDVSSVKVDHSNKSQSILYIQVRDQQRMPNLLDLATSCCIRVYLMRCPFCSSFRIYHAPGYFICAFLII